MGDAMWRNKDIAYSMAIVFSSGFSADKLAMSQKEILR
jgi:hypothetical protein